MRIEYVLLLILGFFPFMYKLGYWQQVFHEQQYTISSFLKYILSEKGRKEYSHFWTALEFPIFLLSIITLFNEPFGYFFYNILFYFLILYNIFVFGKMMRRKIYLPVLDICLSLCLGIVAIFFIGVYFFPQYIYTFILTSLLFVPIYFIISLLILRMKIGKK